MGVEFAIDLASCWHRYQMYGDEDYTYHLDCVARDAVRLFGDSCNLVITCWLHDTLEDTEYTETECREDFGDVVTDAVVLVTKTSNKSYKQYLKDIAENELAWRVKVADTYSNLQHSMIDQNHKRIKKYTNQLNLLYKYKT